MRTRSSKSYSVLFPSFDIITFSVRGSSLKTYKLSSVSAICAGSNCIAGIDISLLRKRPPELSFAFSTNRSANLEEESSTPIYSTS